jgi:DNA-3-methyladenine glycosylase
MTTMSPKPLDVDFYRRDPHELARNLLGCHLVRRAEDTVRRGRIVETEVYGGPDDPASHGDSGEPTARTESMFGPPGIAYIYTIYGMYQCFNVVAPSETKAAAILVRAVAPLDGLRAMARDRGLLEDEPADELSDATIGNLTTGPGKLCQAFDIGPSLDGCPLDGPPLWLEAGEPAADNAEERIRTSSRIGLNRETVGDAVDWPWRYTLADSKFLSRPA